MAKIIKDFTFPTKGRKPGVQHMSEMCEAKCCGGAFYPVTADSPPMGMVVQVPNNEGATLVRKGNLWFLDDMSMYVYYTPTQWRPVPQGA